MPKRDDRSSMNIVRIDCKDTAEKLLRDLEVESGGVAILSDKMETITLYIRDLPTPAVNILKQDALSIGADLAVPSGVITCSKDHFDCILIATTKHLKILSRKELAQPFGLKNLAKQLRDFLPKEQKSTQIMGVVNANDDSFFVGSRYKEADAIERIKEMIIQGATIIDIGAVSSRPGATTVSQAEELQRIRPICDTIKEQKLSTQVLFSIDSYTPSVVAYALESGFGIVNDITGASNPEVIELAHRYGAKICIMHMQGKPKTMQKNPYYDNVMVNLNDFFEERIAKCESIGVKREDIILDVGIGFGKRLEDNLRLIKNLQHFQRFGCEILIGASRKSMIDAITPTPIEERLAGTLAIHLKAVENGASIVRCHDVQEHYQAFAVANRLRSI